MSARSAHFSLDELQRQLAVVLIDDLVGGSSSNHPKRISPVMVTSPASPPTPFGLSPTIAPPRTPQQPLQRSIPTTGSS